MVTNILPYKSGFLLTKCFQKQAKFCVVHTGPEAKRYLDRCLLMSSSSSWKSIVSDGDIISDTKGENAAQGSMHRCKHTEGTLQQYLVQFSFFLKILNVLMDGNSPGAVICSKLGFPIQHFCVGADSIFPRDAHDLAKAAEVKLIEF